MSRPSKKAFNAIRDKAIQCCPDIKAARAAWLKVCDDHPGTAGATMTRARLAMLTALAAGDSIAEAERAARKVLAS